MNSCFQNLIGVNGLCEDTYYPILLDDIGIGLKLASKTADSKFITGKALIERKIAQGWRETLKDLSFDGFQFKKIACQKSFNYDSNPVEIINGSGVITIKKIKKKITSIQISDFIFDGVGSYTVTITDGIETFTYTGTDKILAIPNKFFGQNITIDISFAKANVSKFTSNCGCCNDDSNCNFTINATSNFGLSFVVQEICDSESYLCRYAEMIAEAVQYKVGALILTEIMNTDRINDYNIVNEKDLWTKVSYFDSSMNLFQYQNQVIQSSTSEVLVKDGRYQIEIARLKQLIPIPKDSYCISCTSGFYSVSIP